MQDYFDEIHKALKEFHEWNGRNEDFQAAYFPIKPLYMLIKVDVDSGIVFDQEQAEKYAENHCNNMEYALCDWYYPDNPQYPYIAK